MKKLLLAFICLCSMSFSNEKSEKTKESHSYATVGIFAPFPIPQVGIGYRGIEDNAGIDISLDLGTIIIGNFVSGHCKYIQYFGDNYIATGAKATFAHVNIDNFKYNGASISPEITFGTDKEKTFHQISISIPHIVFNEGLSLIPDVCYQYGMKF